MRDTKKLKRMKFIFGLFSVLFSYVPIIICFIIGFTGSTTVEKIQLTGTCIAAIILALLSVFKYKSILKSLIWVILVGLALVISNISTVIIVCGICDIVSELIFSPLYKHYKNISDQSANNDDLAANIRG